LKFTRKSHDIAPAFLDPDQPKSFSLHPIWEEEFQPDVGLAGKPYAFRHTTFTL